MSAAYDLVVIGSGPGGYVCAIRAAQLGQRVAIVERNATFGGTCLNVGCIPSKALLYASELFAEAGTKFGGFGIEVGTPRLDLARMLAHKDKAVEASVAGIAFLLKKNGVTAYRGLGTIAAAGRVRVVPDAGEPATLETKAIVIATGSEPIPLRGMAIDEERVVSSTGALALREVPRRLVVIGAGVIGLELGSVWRRLGSAVTVVEALDRVLPGMDGEISRQAQRLLSRQGIVFRLGTSIAGIDAAAGGALAVRVGPAAGGGTETLPADVVLVAIGRRPFTAGLGAAEVGVALDAHGRVTVDRRWQTSVAGIYAIGDVIAGPMLAHKAEDEGIAVAEILSGRAGHVNYEAVPAVVYTAPEIASVGRTEEELKAAGTAYRAGKFPMTANGRARAMAATDGFVKVLAEAETDRVLGAHMIGANASETIAEAAVLMEFAGSAEDLARVCHPHPTLSEALREAAMAAWSQPVHL